MSPIQTESKTQLSSLLFKGRLFHSLRPAIQRDLNPIQAFALGIRWSLSPVLVYDIAFIVGSLHTREGNCLLTMRKAVSASSQWHFYLFIHFSDTLILWKRGVHGRISWHRLLQAWQRSLATPARVAVGCR